LSEKGNTFERILSQGKKDSQTVHSLRGHIPSGLEGWMVSQSKGYGDGKVTDVMVSRRV